MKVVLLLAFIGLGSALQYNVQYKYKYEGRLATGIPGIRAQAAALGIKADLIVQMKSKTQAFVQLENVQVGDFNGDVDCAQMRQPIHFAYASMPEPYKTQLEMPFEVHFLEELSQTMKTPEADTEFVTNIRKSVVEMLRIEPVIANLGGIHGERFAQQMISKTGPDAFLVMENTLFGRCESEYTLRKLPNSSAQKEKRELAAYLEKDSQSDDSPRSVKNVPILSESYYKVVRAVNFDKCEDRVVLQHSSISQTSDLGKAQFKEIQSRSSVGTFILKGKPGSFRVERAIVEGDVSTNPYGYKTHKIQSISNKSLVLQSATPIQDLLPITSETKSVKSWAYEVASPFAPPESNPKNWVNYKNLTDDKYFPVLGPKMKPAFVEECKKKILELLDSAAEKIGRSPTVPPKDISPLNSEQAVAVYQIHTLSRLLRGLPVDSIREIFTQVFKQQDAIGQRKQALLIDASAASGASAPIKILLEKLIRQEISEERAVSIFFTLPNNVMNPTILLDLLQYVKSLDLDQQTLLTSSALINYASLLSRMGSDSSFPRPIFGDQNVEPKQIIDDFFPHLTQLLEKHKIVSHRAIIIQAMANLGVPQSMDILKPYIYGLKERNPRLRIIAMYAFIGHKMPRVAQNQIVAMMLEILENPQEESIVRQTAFTIILTWRPSASLYQRLARLTWSEPDQNVAAYITFNLEGLGQSTQPRMQKQASYARSALDLAKPFSRSLHYSYDKMLSVYCPDHKLGVHAQVVLQQSLKELVPSTIYTTMLLNIGGLNVFSEVSVDSEGITEIIQQLIESGSTLLSPVNPRNSAVRQNMQEGLQNALNAWNTTLFVIAYGNMHQYIPIDQITFSRIAGQGGLGFLEKLIDGWTLNITKFINPVDVEYFFPTELGLPVTSLIHAPIVTTGDFEVKLESDIPINSVLQLMAAKSVKLRVKSNAKYLSELIVRIAVPTPWNRKVVVTGTKNFKQISLPFDANVTISRKSIKKATVISLNVTLVPTMAEKQPIVHGFNYPHTAITDMVPSANEAPDMKVIAVKRSRQPVIQFEESRLLKRYTGLDATVRYEGDVNVPFSTFLLPKYREPEQLVKFLVSPTVHQMQYSVLLKPTEETQFSFGTHYFKIPPLEPTSPRQSNRDQKLPNITIEDTDEEKVRKLQQYSESRGVEVKTLISVASFQGQEKHDYGAVYIFTEHPEPTPKSAIPQKIYEKYFLLFFIQPQEPTAAVLTANIKMSTPNLVDFEQFKQIMENRQELKENFSADIKITDKYGYYHRIATINSEAKISPERRREIAAEIEGICNYDRYNPFVDLQTSVIYDKYVIEVKDVDKEKISPEMLNMVKSIGDYVQSLFSPNAYSDYSQPGPQHSVQIKAQRPLSREDFTIDVQTPEKLTKLNVKVPDFVTRVVPWTGLLSSSPKQTLANVHNGETTCYLKKNEVIQFDKKIVKYNPEHCWTMTLTAESPKLLKFKLFTRTNQDGKFEASFILSERDLNVTISKDDLYVNGIETILNRERIVFNADGIIGKVFRESDSIFFRMTRDCLFCWKTMDISVFNNHITVQPSNSFKNKLLGICGDFKGAKGQHALKGPEGCLYDGQEELFKWAYTDPVGRSCDLARHQKFHEQVVDFQKHCPKEESQAQTWKQLSSQYSQKTYNCYQDVFPIRRYKGTDLCVSNFPVRRCTERCAPIISEPDDQEFMCWKAYRAPERVRRAERIGYVKNYVDAVEEYIKVLYTPFDIYCVPK